MWTLSVWAWLTTNLERSPHVYAIKKESISEKERLYWFIEAVKVIKSDGTCLLPAPYTSDTGDFVEKPPVKTNRVVFWSLKLKSTKTIYKTPAIRWLLLQLLNCSFGCSSTRKRQNFGHWYLNRNRDLQRCQMFWRRWRTFTMQFLKMQCVSIQLHTRWFSPAVFHYCGSELKLCTPWLLGDLNRAVNFYGGHHLKEVACYFRLKQLLISVKFSLQTNLRAKWMSRQFCYLV